MKRRRFLSYLGAGIAAAMIPFTRPIFLSAPKKAKEWPGIRAALNECRHCYELSPPTDPEIIDFLKVVHAVQKSRNIANASLIDQFTPLFRRKPEETIEMWTDQAGVDYIKRLANKNRDT